jgi:predicted Zn-dependent peptidase
MEGSGPEENNPMRFSCPERTIDVSRLPNGVTVITERVDSVRSVAAGIWVEAGARYEAPEECGISHFIEHMLFQGTETRSAQDLARQMDALGGLTDAFTGRELVSYSFKVLDENLAEALEIHADLVLRPRFEEEAIEKEKGVILEELKMETDNPETYLTDVFVRHFWRRHPLGQPIIGTRKSIRAFHRDQLRAFHRRYYQPENLTLAAAGRVEHGRFLEIAERFFGSLPPGGARPAAQPPRPAAPWVLKSRRSLQQVHVCLGAPAVTARDERTYTAFLLNMILGATISSRLFQNIRERQGLAYSIFSDLVQYLDAGWLGIYAGASPESARRLVRGVMDELKRLKEEPVPEDELRHARQTAKSAMLLSLDSMSSRMSSLARQWITHGRFYSLEEVAAAVDRVTAAQVQALAREMFAPGRVGLAMLGRVGEAGIGPGDLEC